MFSVSHRRPVRGAAVLRGARLAGGEYPGGGDRGDVGDAGRGGVAIGDALIRRRSDGRESRSAAALGFDEAAARAEAAEGYGIGTSPLVLCSVRNRRHDVDRFRRHHESWVGEVTWR
ncbi:putative classical arabinogalactan protein 9 [Iris pallida]|uniref:Classical arabinogalactan protein 9 n=1 Tax=Iris pallida TaxID=29817 RepID=A0AAX6GT10_IRIPA|nr:putative classical arabinogalactan protein 9 [Iris pallida]